MEPDNSGIDSLPFNSQELSLLNYRYKEADHLAAAEGNALKQARIKLFYRLLKCGLSNGSGFIALKGKEQISYVVSEVDFVFFEFKAVRYDLESDRRYIRLREEIENSRIDGIIGHMGTEMINV